MKNTQQKTLIVNIITFIIGMIGIFSPLIISASALLWIGVVSFFLNAVLSSPALSSGTLPSNWTTTLWITNIAGVLNALVTYFGDVHILPVNIALMIVTGITFFINTFIKDYGNGNLLTRERI